MVFKHKFSFKGCVVENYGIQKGNILRYEKISNITLYFERKPINAKEKKHKKKTKKKGTERGQSELILSTHCWEYTLG